MNSFRTVDEYRNHLRHIVSKSGFLSEAYKIKVSQASKNKRAGLIFTEGITFQDGAFLKFEEKIEIDAGNLNRLKSSYHFERGTYYFRYDKDKLRARGLAHAENHLH